MSGTEARLQTAPDFLSNTGLCRLESRLMDRLQVRPGDYIRIQRIPSSRDETTRSIIARSWLRCRPFQENAQQDVPTPLPAVQLDPMLSEHLRAQDDEVVFVCPCRNVELASTITLHCTTNLAEGDREKLERILKFKGWPLFRGAIYALRYGDRPLAFQVCDDLEPPTVLGIGTGVIFRSPDDLAQLQRTAHIAQARAELEACTLRRKALEQERHGLEKRLQHFQDEKTRLQSILEKLDAEERDLENSAGTQVRDEETLRNRIQELQQQRQQLQSRLEAVDYPDLAELDLNAARTRLERARTELDQALDRLIRHLQRR